MVVASTTLELELMTETAERLREIALEKEAFLHSDTPTFRLSSGKLSNHYFEGKKITLSSQGARHVGKMVLDEINGLEVDAVGGIVIGAALIVAAVAAVADEQDKDLPTFIVREEAKTHGTKRKIEGYLQKGWKVAIVDDVITTGGSVFKAIEAAEEAGCKVVKVIVLVDRHEGGSNELRSRGYNFQAFLRLNPSGEVTIEESAVATT